MREPWKRFAAYWIAGVLVGAAIAAFALYPRTGAKTVTVKTISGAPLSVDKVIPLRGETVINTSYTGTGSSEIIIPNSSIPAAHAWDTRRIVAGGFISSDKTFYPGGGYRWESITVLGGAFAGSRGYGLWAGAFVMF